MTGTFPAESLAFWELIAPGCNRDRDHIWDASRLVGERMVAALATAARHSRLVMRRRMLVLGVLAALAAPAPAAADYDLGYTDLPAPGSQVICDTQTAVARLGNCYVAAGAYLTAIKSQDGYVRTPERWRQPVTGNVAGIATTERNGGTDVVASMDSGFLQSYHGADGTARWSRDLRRPGCISQDVLSAAPVVQLHSRSDSAFTSATNDDLVFVPTHYGCLTTTENRVYAFHASDGTLAWVFNDRTRGGTYDMDYAQSACTVDYRRDTLYCGTNGTNGQRTLWAISTVDGSLRWAVNAGAIRSTPTLSPDGTRLYVRNTDATLRALDPGNSGHQLWSVTFPAFTQNFRYLSPTVYQPAGGVPVVIVDTSLELPSIAQVEGFVDHGTSAQLLWQTLPLDGLYVTTTPLVDPTGHVFISTTQGVAEVGATGNGQVQAFWRQIYGRSGAITALAFDTHATGSAIDRLEVSDSYTLFRFGEPWRQGLPARGPDFVLSPSQATIQAGQAQSYTATYASPPGGDITNSPEFGFGISADGSCGIGDGSFECRATTAGPHTVTTTVDGWTHTAQLTVTPGPLTHIVLTTPGLPPGGDATEGQTVSLHVEGFDQYGNATADYTSASTYAIAPDGTCSGTSCTPSEEGPHTITARYRANIEFQSLTSTAALGVLDAPLSATAPRRTFAFAGRLHGQRATFTDRNPLATSSDFKARIDWGDGTAAPALIGQGDPGFTVSAPHNYARPGRYTITITVSDVGGATAKVTSTVFVVTPPTPSPATAGAT